MKINRIAVMGYLVVGLFIYSIVSQLTTNPMIFVNKEAIVVIIGGLVVSLFASFPFYTIRQTFLALKKIMTSPHQAPVDAAAEIVELSYLLQKGLPELEKESENIEHPFLKEGVEMLLNGVPKSKILEILEKRASERRDSLAQDVNVMMTLGKYCPALGLAATVLGLVELLVKLENPNMGEMGLGMAVALSATFYGIIIANLIFTPLSELLLSSGETDHKAREMIIDGVMALTDREHPLIVIETVNSYLPFQMRLENHASKIEKPAAVKMRGVDLRGRAS
jgi:chemotaxis protein MotA